MFIIYLLCTYYTGGINGCRFDVQSTWIRRPIHLDLMSNRRGSNPPGFEVESTQHPRRNPGRYPPRFFRQGIRPP